MSDWVWNGPIEAQTSELLAAAAAASTGFVGFAPARAPSRSDSKTSAGTPGSVIAGAGTLASGANAIQNAPPIFNANNSRNRTLGNIRTRREDSGRGAIRGF
ncbi:MAG: hypothetical protein IPH99_10375 [Xanthomonadales bacterium]|nr:hypothetical protein [Xanthomonadales bacterium]